MDWIYIVVKAEMHEDTKILGVYFDHALAMAEAKAWKADHTPLYGGWVEIRAMRPNTMHEMYADHPTREVD